MNLKHPTTGKVLFSKVEIRSKGNGEIRLAAGFKWSLVLLRVTFDRPMTVTSFCRDPVHNAREGGHQSSAHLTHNSKWKDDDGDPLGTFGLDVWTPDSSYRAALAATAYELGWSVGVNFAQNFLHLDKRGDYIGRPARVLFGY